MGSPGGTLDASAYPAAVSLLERRGRRARIRYEHVAGWVDSALLFPSLKQAQAKQAPRQQQLGLLGLLSTGNPQRAQEEPAGGRWSCARPVRLVSESEASQGEKGTARFVVGSIPAGVHFAMRQGEGVLRPLVGGYVVAPQAGAKLSVPARDIATAECVEGPASASASASASSASPEEPATDAIDALDDAAEAASAAADDSGVGLFGSSGEEAGLGLGFHPTAPGATPRPGAGVRLGTPTVSGRLPPEVISRIVRQSYRRFQRCYEQHAQSLVGSLSVRFTIDRSGAVSNAARAGGDFQNPELQKCILEGFGGLSFPQPEGGVVVVTYPVLFNKK
jgi:hypothetical protein